MTLTLVAAALVGAAVLLDEPTVFRGRVLDRESGNAVPSFWFAAVDPSGRSELLVTDADGRFRSESPFASGDVKLELRDHADPDAFESDAKDAQPWRQGRALRLTRGKVASAHPSASEIVVPISTGPTYRFDATLPEGTEPSEFVVVFEHGADHASGEMRRRRRTGPNLLFGEAFADDLIALNATPLRGDGELWARFFALFSFGLDEVGPPWPIEVRSLDGWWRGAGSVNTITSGREERLFVEFERCGQVAGRIVDADGRALPHADVTLVPTRGDERRRPRAAAGDADGQFAFAWLPPGDYVVRATHDDNVSGSIELTARTGEVVHPEVVLRPPAGSVDVEVTLRTTSGEPVPLGVVSLESLNDPRTSFEIVATAGSSPAGFAGSVRFANVPVGRYEARLTVHGVASIFDPQSTLPRLWLPDRLELDVTAATSAELLCLDDAPTRDLTFRVFDAETDAPIDRPGVVVWMKSVHEMNRLLPEWPDPRFANVPQNAPLRWVVRKDGYRAAVGDASAFVRSPDGDQAVVRLERGWGEQLRVQTPGGRGLEGADVRLDGVPAGVTDDSGVVLVTADAAPQRIDVGYRDWEVDWASGIDAESGRVTGSVGRQLIVQLLPPDPR